MSARMPLRQVLLQFCQQAKKVRADISAIALTPDAHLWVGSDELTSIERLSPISPTEYGHHQQFALGDYVDLPGAGSEIDIEGMDFAEGYLWVVGSHSTKRKRAKGKNPKDDIRRLLEITTDDNRYLLARIPIVDGVPVKHDPGSGRFAASLAQSKKGNVARSELTQALKDDQHIGPFLKMRVPSKDNGFDIEAIAVKGHQLFLGLRGPVLRGMAIILEVEVMAEAGGRLTLKRLANKKRYRKHFVDLNGLGIRDLCFQGNDLMILAGATMQLSVPMQLFRFRHALGHTEDTLWLQSSARASEALIKQFDLPWVVGSDNAEGMTLLPCDTPAGNGADSTKPDKATEVKGSQRESELLVVYDSPSDERLKQNRAIVADVFCLSP
ncbi:MAG: DUF3616 domain-containing protein [Cyanobacteria bacterium J06627_28]